MDTALHIRVVWGAIVIVLLSGIDATLTLMHINNAGGTEWNPAMAFVLDHYGQFPFVWVKMTITSVGVGVLACYYNRLLWTRYPFWGIACAYVVLTIYHIYCIVTYWET